VPASRHQLDAAAVKAQALAIGFDLCGIAPADDLPALQFFHEWLARGYGGEMHYLSRSAGRRMDARAVMPSARSVIMLGTLYNTDRPYSTEVSDPGAAVVSRYAWGDDYHRVIGERLDALMAWMRAAGPESIDLRGYVDTGPIQERAYAQRAGLGWIGKNTCLINPDLGSWIFLAAVICSAPLEADAPGLDQCGTCTLCLEACPTAAFPEPGVLDATRCLSYLTIELKGGIPSGFREALENRVYGCDICQEVCPWNAAAPAAAATVWQPRRVFDGARLETLWAMSDRELRRELEGGPMTRAGVRGLRRNLAVALGNAGGDRTRGLLDEASRDDARPSARHPVVAEHVDWATTRAK
jgi:epoxyqueuosine reductase